MPLMPPNYFITGISDRWIHSETKLAKSFRKLILPEKFPPHTPLVDLVPLPVEALKKLEFVNFCPEWRRFNKIHTQVFKSLFDTDDNVLLELRLEAEKRFALLWHWSKDEESGRAVCIAPFQEQ